jgi:two-component sensor histidine kinase
MLFSFDISEKSSNVDLLPKSSYYLDCNNDYNLTNIEKAPFEKTKVETLTFGIVPNCSLWIRFQLHNTTHKLLSKVIEYANAKSEDVYFYDGNQTFIDGMFHIDKEKRSSLNPVFSITLQADKSKIYYIQSHSKIATLIARVKLYNREDFLLYDLKQQFYFIIFFSVIFVLLFYNLMLYLFTKDSAYLFYTFYMLTVILFESIYSGMAHIYLFSNEMTIFITKAALFYLSLLAISMILFLMKFLRTKRFTKLHKLLKSYLYLLPLITLLGYDNFLFNLNIMIVYITLAIVIIVTAIYAYFHRTKEALYYLIGWSFVLIAIIFSALKALGIYHLNIEYINEIAFVFEAIMFSIALAHRINILTAEKESISQQLIALQQKEKEELEQIVMQRTKELIDTLAEKELLYSELNHRVKNNLQMILSLIKLQINNTTLQDTKEQLTITKNRINSISKLYEILYLKNTLNKLDTLEYFQNIVSTIEENFNKNITVIYDIKHNIDVKNLIYCGLILNELVTNSFKYAFEKDGKIVIEIYKKDTTVYMNIKDNGKGFHKKTKHSLGLTIVQTLVEKQLLGKIKIDSKNGTSIMTEWKE